MRAGDLNRRITIQRRGTATDSWGTPIPGVENWIDVGRLWASIKTLSGLGTIKADAKASTIKTSIRVRWRTDLAAGMRVLYGGTVYDVQAVLPDVAGREHVDLVCEVAPMSFTIDADTTGLESYLDELGDEAEAAVRPAAQAGAQVLYEQVQRNVAGLGRRTGKLAASIYQAYSASKSGDGKATYDVSWNRRKAPHGHLVEYGYLQRYVYRPDGMGPVVRPGMDGKPRPGRRATREQKDAYYVTLPAPRIVPGKAFVRGAASVMDAAYKAAEAEMRRRIAQKGGV